MKIVLKTIAITSLLISSAASAASGWQIEKDAIASPKITQGDEMMVSSFEKENGKLVFSVIMVSNDEKNTVGKEMLEVDTPIMVNGKLINMKVEAIGQMKSYNPKTEQETQYILNEFKTKDGVVIENTTYPTNNFNQAFEKLK
ncbi:hypothetical protein ETN89_20040 (plasmid) [Photobacterium damselae subsp. damselae]|uniref:hypothetical protein n=1 Tax=Photobacterium damselae TaxID=38293 RepID=UPI000A300AF1|nr:hypothetical protein [Photobacterium damselae]ARR51756.1 hypothetical protein CAY62_20340 [Photobacterium damselae subsp. damselae]QAY37551.1 hypothetical protein ETN89_20040 [Photobacterium damselae subsp. damselae]